LRDQIRRHARLIPSATPAGWSAWQMPVVRRFRKDDGADRRATSRRMIRRCARCSGVARRQTPVAGAMNRFGGAPAVNVNRCPSGDHAPTCAHVMIGRHARRNTS
jgi:hypothetical protein